VSEAKRQSPDAAMRARERRGVVMTAAKKRTRAEQESAEQQRLATILREAHGRLELWRTCSNESCFRTGSCNGDVDQCGARAAPQGWAWMHQIVKALRTGQRPRAAIEAANLAALGYRKRVTVRWKVKGWEPIELVQLGDGSWRRADLAAARPPLDPQFMQLAASSWLHSACRRARARKV
jgi:hypothetical protein